VLSVIVPVYNRLENLKTCIESLGNQKDIDNEDYEIIVVDDGSTDGVEKWVKDVTNIRYLSGGPNKGFRGGRARNIGAFNASGDRFVFVDSDVVLNEYALYHYVEAAKASPDAIIVGRYFYLPPILFGEHTDILRRCLTYDELDKEVKRLGLSTMTDPYPVIKFGIDLGGRPEQDYTDDPKAVRQSDGLGGLSGNISYPKDLFLKLGGFEEMMVGHGGEDAELGLHAGQFGTNWLFYKPITGYHIWHERDQARNHREVQANIAFIDARYGVGKYANAQKYSESRDFRDKIHYHKHVGAIAIKIRFDNTVYAARTDLKTRIGLTKPEVFIELGFDYSDVLVVEQDVLDSYKWVGNA
jgi:glycosyltransferase involved in cell wall biosynthesis